MNTPTTARSDFASRLYDKLAGTQAGKNLFLSPFSIRVALAMCPVWLAVVYLDVRPSNALG